MIERRIRSPKEIEEMAKIREERSKQQQIKSLEDWKPQTKLGKLVKEKKTVTIEVTVFFYLPRRKEMTAINIPTNARLRTINPNGTRDGLLEASAKTGFSTGAGGVNVGKRVGVCGWM